MRMGGTVVLTSAYDGRVVPGAALRVGLLRNASELGQPLKPGGSRLNEPTRHEYGGPVLLRFSHVVVATKPAPRPVGNLSVPLTR
jgi:hypothetical protein